MHSVPSAIAFDGVTRRFGSTVAVDHLSISIPIGTTVALLGPNGAGKTTTIGLMLGLLGADAGEVRTLGLEPREAVATGRIGAMLQDGGMTAGVTVRELVGFARRLYPEPMALDRILEQAGLATLAERRVEALSGGETQRLRFALSIAGDPDLIFLDEPTVAMDVESRLGFWRDMRASADQGRTVLFATHYLEEADQVADRIVVMNHGRVVADGSAAAIKAEVSGRTVRFTLPHPDPAQLAGLPGVTATEVHGETVRLRTDDADATVQALYAAGIGIRNLEVTGADLESAFLAITGSDRAA